MEFIMWIVSSVVAALSSQPQARHRALPGSGRHRILTAA